MKTIVHIQNLNDGCVNTVSKTLNALDDVSDVRVEVEYGSVTFEYSDPHTIELVTNTLSEIGYPEEGKTNSFSSKVKSYVSCAFSRFIY